MLCQVYQKQIVFRVQLIYQDLSLILTLFRTLSMQILTLQPICNCGHFKQSEPFRDEQG